MTYKPKINISTYEDAMRFLMRYEESWRNMSHLIEDFMPEDFKMVLSCSDEDQLKYHCRKMRGLSEKILKSHPVASNILKLRDAKTREEYELSDERVCIQLEENKIPENSLVSLFYLGVKSQRAESFMERSNGK